MKLRFAFRTDSKLYLVIDHYKGRDLYFHLRMMNRQSKEGFSEKVTRFFVAEVVLALGHLHSKDIIYRDLKPENILLHQSGHICLTDFRLMKGLDPLISESHTLLPAYIAPESIGMKGHGKAVDWWALGILTYELYTGQLPFEHNKKEMLERKIQKENPRYPRYMNIIIKDFVTKVLEKDPKKRLGYGKGDADDIQKHIWFMHLKWNDLLELKIIPPYKPRIKSTMDTSNFSKTFTTEKITDTYAEAISLESEDFTINQPGNKIFDLMVGIEV